MLSNVKAWEHELESLHQRLGDLFKRPEPRQRSLAYLKGLLSTVERKVRAGAVGCPYRARFIAGVCC
ncbi:hypothetical protein BGLA2_60011 [Burkholderia gladioli]|nr:hypothetical protein BGLA2_60011 [Burkholderia gladioli]